MWHKQRTRNPRKVIGYYFIVVALTCWPPGAEPKSPPSFAIYHKHSARAQFTFSSFEIMMLTMSPMADCLGPDPKPLEGYGSSGKSLNGLLPPFIYLKDGDSNETYLTGSFNGFYVMLM